jgi:parvulin-like peptidyl-prolyl isomerase
VKHIPARSRPVPPTTARRRGRRPAALAAAAAAAPLVLSGCQTNPAAAAVIGPVTISTSTLTATVDAASHNASFRSQQPNRTAAVRGELTRLVTEALVGRVAAAHHITVTKAEIDAEEASLSQQIASSNRTTLQNYYASSGVPSNQIRGLVRALALLNKIGTALVAGIPVGHAELAKAYRSDVAQFTRVHVAHILVKSHALAERLLAKVRAHPSSFAALARKYSIDTGSAKNGGDLGTASPSSYVAPFAKAAETAPIGSYVLVHSQYGWHIVHVISRSTQTLAQATPALKEQLLSSRRQALVTAAIQAAGKKVRINPRFGRWDDSSLAVVAGSPTTSTPSPSGAAPSSPTTGTP